MPRSNFIEDQFDNSGTSLQATNQVAAITELAGIIDNIKDTVDYVEINSSGTLPTATGTDTIAIGPNNNTGTNSSSILVGSTLTGSTGGTKNTIIGSNNSSSDYNGYSSYNSILVGDGITNQAGDTNILIGSQVSANYYYGPSAESIIIGNNITIEGTGNLVAIGKDLTELTTGTITLGTNNSPKGARNITVGLNNDLGATFKTPTDSIIIGQTNQATKQDAVIFGNNNISNSKNSVVIGKQATANSPDNGNDNNVISIGTESKVTSSGTIAIGHQTRSQGDNSTSIGALSSVEPVDVLQTGTINVSSSNSTVVGQSTNFTSLSPGDIIVFGPDNSITGVIDTISSNTLLSLTENPDVVFGFPNNNPFSLRTNTANQSVAVGENVTVSGSNNTAALGSSITVTESNNTVAVGTGLSASVNNQILIGSIVTGRGANSILIGPNTYEDNYYGNPIDNNVVIGSGANVTESLNGIALGNAAGLYGGPSGITNAVQIGSGSNSNSNTIKFMSITIASNEGIMARYQTTGTTPSFTAPNGTLVLDQNGTLYGRANGAWVTI